MRIVRILLILVIIFLAGSLASELYAQCPMCKLAAEANLKEGGSTGMGLNAGILYLLAFPYTAALIIGLIWYRANRKAKLQA